jgi:MerR family transcriptional regulator, light-induced transcriptional regulator
MKVGRGREAKYPIRSVSRLTGVSIDTLRAWERRYRAVTPTRDERGRLYSEADIARLRLLNQAVLSGHSIGRAAALSDAALRRLQSVAGAAAPEPVAPVHADFRAALARFDSVAVDRELARLAAVMAPADLVRDVLLPELRAVGDQWKRGQGGVAREHLMSAAIRHLLGSFLRLHARPERGVRLLFATPSGDRHEIGTLGAAMLAASRGFAVTYLGPDLPVAQILEAARVARNVSVLVLGVTLPSPLLARELRAVVRDLPRGVELWAGGAAAARHHRLISARGLVLSSLDAYVEQLTRLAGLAA